MGGGAAAEAMESRLQRLEDERDIQNTLNRYGSYADAGNHSAFVDLFTEDATIELVGGTPDGLHGDFERWNLAPCPGRHW